MLSIAFFLLNTFTLQAHAACGSACDPMVKVIEDKQNNINRVKVILIKNQDYLKKNPTASPSIAVKIRSNVLMSNLQIETLTNESTVLIAEAELKGCKGCLTPNPSTKEK